MTWLVRGDNICTGWWTPPCTFGCAAAESSAADAAHPLRSGGERRSAVHRAGRRRCPCAPRCKWWGVTSRGLACRKGTQGTGLCAVVRCDARLSLLPCRCGIPSWGDSITYTLYYTIIHRRFARLQFRLGPDDNSWHPGDGDRTAAGPDLARALLLFRALTGVAAFVRGGGFRRVLLVRRGREQCSGRLCG